MKIICSRIPVDPAELVYFPPSLSTGSWQVVHSVLESVSIPDSVKGADVRNNVSRLCRARVQLAYEFGRFDVRSGETRRIETGLRSYRNRRVALELVRNHRAGVQPLCCYRAVEMERVDACVVSEALPRLSPNYRLAVDRINVQHVIHDRAWRFRRPGLLNANSLERAVQQSVDRGQFAGAIRLGKIGRTELTRAVPMCPISLGADEICDAIGLVEHSEMVTVLTIAQGYFAAAVYGDIPSWLVKVAGEL